jgi:peptidoglycan-N-acetylglucosamine deacetylase
VVRVALTFDDGPSEWSQPILNILARNDAPATFFVVGSTAERRRDLLERMTAEGHEIGNHMWSHPSLTEDCDDARVRRELQRTNELVAQVVGVPPQLFRAPHFAVDERVEAVASSLGLRHVSADVRPPDWHSRWTAKLTVTFVLNRVQPDSIICLHDGIPPAEADPAQRQATVEAVEEFLPRLAERGVRFVTASRLLDEQSP